MNCLLEEEHRVLLQVDRERSCSWENGLRVQALGFSFARAVADKFSTKRRNHGPLWPLAFSVWGIGTHIHQPCGGCVGFLDTKPVGPDIMK